MRRIVKPENLNKIKIPHHILQEYEPSNSAKLTFPFEGISERIEQEINAAIKTVEEQADALLRDELVSAGLEAFSNVQLSLNWGHEFGLYIEADLGSWTPFGLVEHDDIGVQVPIVDAIQDLEEGIVEYLTDSPEAAPKQTEHKALILQQIDAVITSLTEMRARVAATETGESPQSPR